MGGGEGGGNSVVGFLHCADQVPARRRGHRLGTTINYLRRTTSAAEGNSKGTTIKCLVNQNAGAGSNLAKGHYTKAGREFF
jgi:hypothetical protein